VIESCHICIHAKGAVLDPNKEEWWGFDTTHSGVGDVQGISTDKVLVSSALQRVAVRCNVVPCVAVCCTT